MRRHTDITLFKVFGKKRDWFGYVIVCCLLPVACCLLPVACCLLSVVCCLLSLLLLLLLLLSASQRAINFEVGLMLRMCFQ